MNKTKWILNYTCAFTMRSCQNVCCKNDQLWKKRFFFFVGFFFKNVILLISGMLKVRSESRHLAQYLIPATAPWTEMRATAGRSLVLPLKVWEEEMEGGSVLARALLHQRYEESFHLVSCESERTEGWVGRERQREREREKKEILWLALSWVSHLSS